MIIVEEVYEEPRQEGRKVKQQMVFNFNVTGNNNSFIQSMSIALRTIWEGESDENKLQPFQPEVL